MLASADAACAPRSGEGSRDISAHAKPSATPAQAAGAAWALLTSRTPRHGRARSTQRGTRIGHGCRQRPGSSDSSTAAAAPSAREQERAAAAAACSHSLGCDRRNASDTARREHAPMGNSASSARKAALLTARGTYRGPPTWPRRRGPSTTQHGSRMRSAGNRATQQAAGERCVQQAAEATMRGMYRRPPAHCNGGLS